MQTPVLDWLRDAPLWQSGAALLLWLLAAREAGRLFRLRHDARHPGHEERLTETGFLVSAILGLLALLIGFTFSMALNRFEARQGLVQQEALALSTFADRQLVIRGTPEIAPPLADVFARSSGRDGWPCIWQRRGQGRQAAVGGCRNPGRDPVRTGTVRAGTAK